MNTIPQSIVLSFLFITISIGQKQTPQYNFIEGNRFDQAISKTIQDSNITILGVWANGPCEEVFVDSNYAFIQNGAALNIVDITNTENPQMVGQLITEGTINEIYVEGTFAYLANYSRGWIGNFQIIDISNPIDPLGVSNTYLGSFAHDIQVKDYYAYIANGYSGLRVYNVDNPYSPIEVSRVCDNGYVNSVCVYDSFASVSYFIGDTVSQFLIFNISDPSDPFQLALLEFPEESINDIFYDGNYAYVLGGYPEGKIYKFDVSDPYSPELLYTFFGSSRMNEYDKIFVENNYAYTSLFEFNIFNVIDTTSPYKIYGGGGGAYETHVAGNYTYLASSSKGMSIINVGDPYLPIFEGSYATGGYKKDISVLDDYAYVADRYMGLRIINIRNPNLPHEVGKSDSTFEAMSIDVKDGLAYIAAGHEGLRIYNVNNPSHPEEIGHYVSDFYVNDIQVVNNIAYLLADGHEPNFYIIDITNPASPSQLGSLDIYEYAYDIHVHGDYAYVAAGSGGLRIIDIQNASNPILVGSLGITLEAGCVFVKNNYAFVGGWEAGFNIIDISDPYSPKKICHLEMEGIGEDIYVDGNYAYLGSGGVKIIDIGNIQSPVEVGYFNSAWGRMESISVQNNTIYVANSENGIYILQNELLTDIKRPTDMKYTFWLNQNYPNPFNPSTTIEFTLPKSEYVKLKVFNILGKEVSTLVSNKLNQGNHTYIFDGKNLASGIYYYQLAAGDFREVKKMILLR
jgi:hypothetical protein